MTITDLNSKHEMYEKLLEKSNELQEKQEDLLTRTFQESNTLISWYQEKQFLFTHPSINYQSGRGPILGFDDDENELIIYDPDKGFRKINLRTKEEKNTIIARLVKEGHFETAMTGFKYLQNMLDKYSSDLESDISRLEYQLTRFE